MSDVHVHVRVRVHPPSPLPRQRRRRRKLLQVSSAMVVCCLVSCASFLLCDSFLLQDRTIHNVHIHTLQRQQQRQRRRLSQSLGAVVKDKDKTKENNSNINSKKAKTSSTKSKRSGGYRLSLGIFPFLNRFDQNSKTKKTSTSTSTPDTMTTPIPTQQQQQLVTIGENATNSTATTTDAASTDAMINATAQAGKDLYLNLNTTESKSKSKAAADAGLSLTDKSSKSTNVVGERPELAKSTSSNATKAKASKSNAVNTSTNIATSSISDSKDVKVEAEISWQDKYWNHRWFGYPKAAVVTSKEKPKTTTEKKPSTSASTFPKQVKSSRGNSMTTPLASSVVSPKQVDRTVGSSSSSKESKEPSSSLLPEKKQSDVLTVQDLESFLLTNGFVKRSELEASQKAMSSANALAAGTSVGGGGGKSRGSVAAPTFKTDGSSGSTGVALPQPSVLGYKDLKWGTAASAGFLGMLVGLSILPNLWFMGTLAGFLYGWDVGKKIPDGSPSNALNNLIVTLGRNLAKGFLAVYDAANAIFFMYKTGELSYAYYKRFSVLDDKFKINSKIDAWNARFAEGKVSFDAWERENEIGRKALATMRTIWLVEERSLKKNSKKRRQSRYRPIQFVYDAAFSMGRLFRSIMKMLTGGGSSELQEFLKGIRVEISETRMNEISSRFGAVVAALVFVSVTGALYSISPFFLAFLAISVGVIWPSWVSEFYDRTSRFLDDTRARGRGEEVTSNVFSQLSGRYDKSKFHYYVTMDGKKRYYRTGKPVFPIAPTQEERKRKLSKKFPWQQPG